MEFFFEWDTTKDKKNIAKHGVSFNEAKYVFADRNSLTLFNRIEKGEQRWQTIGITNDCLLLIVIHTLIDNINNVEIIRIISARKATKNERKIYEQNCSSIF